MPASVEQCDFLWEKGDPVAALRHRFGWASLPDAAAALAAIAHSNYGLTIQTIERIAISSANAVVWLYTSTERYILKLCALSAAHPALAARTALVDWLAGANQPVPAIRPSLRGEYQLVDGRYSLALHHWVDGAPLNASDHGQARTAGAALARLHITLARYPARADFAPLILPATSASLCAELSVWLRGRPADQRRLGGVLERIAARWQALDPTELPQGLAHNDYRAANLLFRGPELLAVLDFEELGWNYWIVDLAWAAVFLGTRYRDWGPLDPAVQATFLDAYHTVRPLAAAERAILPVLLTLGSVALARAGQTPELQAASLAAADRLAEQAGLLAAG